MVYLNTNQKKRNKKRTFTSFFQPDICVTNFNEIDLNRIKSLGIKWILCDLDNTLVPHYKILPDKNSLKFINNCQKLKFDFVIISNNRLDRVKKFASFANIDNFCAFTLKPFTFKVKKFINKHHIDIKKVIIIGDQLVTDILLANVLNIKSILVTPLVNNNYKVNVFTKYIENSIYSQLERDNLIIKKKHSRLFHEDNENYL